MRYKKSDISADQIVSAAIRVLSRKGYARTSLMDIAREAEMSKGAVHYHFPSKDELIQKVLETACDEVARRSLDAWNNSGNPLENLRASLEELWLVRVGRTDEAKIVADMIAQSQYDEALRPKLAAYFRYATGQTYDHLMAQVLAVGIKTRIPVEMIPRILLALLDGLVVQAFVEPEALRTEDVVKSLETIALSLFELPEGLLPR